MVTHLPPPPRLPPCRGRRTDAVRFVLTTRPGVSIRLQTQMGMIPAKVPDSKNYFYEFADGARRDAAALMADFAFSTTQATRRLAA